MCGENRNRSDSRAVIRAHPRVCGENDARAGLRRSPAGSSPRVRGKHPDACLARGRPRLIPACAGKTRPPSKPDQLGRAHPRVCGENYRVGAITRLIAGSSPRVRGKRDRRGDVLPGGGLIPACAGKTEADNTVIPGLWAHPRVCGENVQDHTVACRVEGSSPRVRGKLFCPFNQVTFPGLIPACAGKTPRGPQRNRL